YFLLQYTLSVCRHTISVLKTTDASLSFFFLMTRQPPRSTLFPSRRSSDLPTILYVELRASGLEFTRFYGVGNTTVGSQPDSAYRSEEHTSELQSRSDLVCRLLLEKKKT